MLAHPQYMSLTAQISHPGYNTQPIDLYYNVCCRAPASQTVVMLLQLRAAWHCPQSCGESMAGETGRLSSTVAPT